MRLLQLNIWEGRLIRRLPPFIKEVDADVVCLQEVYSSESTAMKPSRMLNSLQQISAVCDYPHQFFSPTFSSVYEDAAVDYGNAILSRWPLSNEQAVFTSGSYNPHRSSKRQLPEGYNLQTAKVSSPNGDFSIANHHAYLGPDSLGDENNVRSMRFACEQLRDLPKPLIFAGDLNVRSESPALRVFAGFLEDLTATWNIRSTLNEFGKVDDVACDHILVSPEVSVQKFTVSEAIVSDHKALILDFSL